ncbi:MAG: hypothetical protein ABS934_14385 [Psychrobacillus sp.]
MVISLTFLRFYVLTVNRPIIWWNRPIIRWNHPIIRFDRPILPPD